jgi:hypothetical protein
VGIENGYPKTDVHNSVIGDCSIEEHRSESDNHNAHHCAITHHDASLWQRTLSEESFVKPRQQGANSEEQIDLNVNFVGLKHCNHLIFANYKKAY